MKIKLIIVTACLLASTMLTGCIQTLSENPAIVSAGFRYAGQKTATEVLENNPENVQVVVSVKKAIDSLMASDTEIMLYSAIESWYVKQMKKVELMPLEKQLLEQILIVPLWTRLKSKYGGTALVLDNPKVRSDLTSFSVGLGDVLQTYIQ